MDQGSERSDTIRVALIDDNRLVRKAIASVLNACPDIEAVAEGSNGHEALLDDGVDVVLLSLGRKSEDILRVARDILSNLPDVGMIAMDLLPAQEDLHRFISAGVSGFIMKDAPLDVVLSTIRSVACGHKVLPDEMTATLFCEITRETGTSGGTQNPDPARLTPREKEVSALVSESLSNKAIGEELHISVHTVKSHLRNIMDKLRVKSRLQIATFAHQQEAHAAELRLRAEAHVEKELRKSPTEPERLPADEVEKTVHELQVHQIELEMQNEELRRSEAELEASRKRYFDLFDLAPVGYFTLTADGRTLEANLTAAGFLRVSRSDLLDRAFTRFIHPEDQDVFYRHRRVVMKNGSRARCRLRLVRDDGSSFQALLESAPSRPVDDQATFRIVMSARSDPKEEPGTD